MRDQVQWFAEQMEKKLTANDHKGGWGGEPDNYFLECIDDELNELESALMSDNITAAINECVDVANFAMMLADNLRKG